MNKEEKDSFIKENYKSKGAVYCGGKLAISVGNVRYKTKKMGLTKERVRHDFDPTPFLDVRTKEAAYLLGFIFADGTVKGNSIVVKIITEDFNAILPTIRATGGWKIRNTYPENRMPATIFSVTNKEFAAFLLKHSFHAKSECSAESIIKKIPENLRRYFWLGLIDGDGCWYFHEKRGICQFYISSSYEQDWTYAEDMLKSIGAEYTIQRVVIDKKNGKTHKYSCIRITNRHDVSLVKEYVYPNEYEFGLKRKYDKANKIFELQKTNPVFRRLSTKKSRQKIV